MNTNETPPPSPAGYGPAFKGDGQTHDDKGTWLCFSIDYATWGKPFDSAIADSRNWYCKPLIEKAQVPKQPDGYCIPTLGGEGLGEPNKTDLCWLVDKWTGAFGVSARSQLEFVRHLYYTRQITSQEKQAQVKGEPEWPLIEGKPIGDWLHSQFPATVGNFHLERWLLQLSDFYHAVRPAELTATVPVARDTGEDVIHLLAVLGEEGCEISQACSKSIRFGLSDRNVLNPSSPTNRERIVDEANDFLGTMQLLIEQGIIPADWQNVEKQAAKKQKVLKFMDYARTVGALEKAGEEKCDITTQSEAPVSSPAPGETKGAQLTTELGWLVAWGKKQTRPVDAKLAYKEGYIDAVNIMYSLYQILTAPTWHSLDNYPLKDGEVFHLLTPLGNVFTESRTRKDYWASLKGKGNLICPAVPPYAIPEPPGKGKERGK